MQNAMLKHNNIPIACNVKIEYQFKTNLNPNIKSIQSI